MRDQLRQEQYLWGQLLRNAPTDEILLTEVIKEEKSPPLNTSLHGSGACNVCHKVRHLWAGICGWCGADPEDFEEV